MRRFWAIPEPWIAIVFWVVGFFYPRRFVYEADRDEGFNLIKTLLVDRGFALYSEIWSDQPPGFTYLLLGFTRIWGRAPETARLLPWSLVALMLAALAYLGGSRASRKQRFFGAFCATVPLCLTTDFLRTSASLMIGLPALGLLMAGFALVLAERGRAASFLGGAFLGSAVVTKLFVVPLIPALLVGLLVQGRAAPRRKVELGEAAPDSPTSDSTTSDSTTSDSTTSDSTTNDSLKNRWPLLARRLVGQLGWVGLGCAIVLALGLVPFVLSNGGEALYRTHYLAQQMGGSLGVRQILLDDAWFLLCGVPGALAAFRRRSPAGLTGLAAALLGALALSQHSPVWNHHRYLIWVPYSLVVAESGKLLLRMLQAGGARRWLYRPIVVVGSMSFVAGALSISPVLPFSETLATFRPVRPARRLLAAEGAVRREAPEARTLATSRQMYAYRLDLAVPPALSVTSEKRFRSGELDPDRLVAMVLQARPDAVLMDSRWPRKARARLRAALGRDYELRYHDRRNRRVQLFVRTHPAARGSRRRPRRIRLPGRTLRAPTRRSRPWFFWLWLLPTNLVGYLMARALALGPPLVLRGPAVDAWVFRLPPGRHRWIGAVALGNVVLISDTMACGTSGLWTLAHELAHTRQHDWLGPLYLPLHGFCQLTSTLLTWVIPRPPYPGTHAYNALERAFIAVPYDSLLDADLTNRKDHLVLSAFGIESSIVDWFHPTG